MDSPACFICCQRQKNLCDFTSQKYKDAAEKLSGLITIQIQVNICLDCIDTLNVVHAFLQRCKEAEQRLKEELPLDKKVTTVEEQPLDLTKENLAQRKMDIDEDRKNVVQEEAKPVKSPSGNNIYFEFCCEICGSSFEKDSELRQHMKTHAKDRPKRIFNCRICSKPYSSRSNLKRHEKRTHWANGFGCDFCGKRFDSLALLKEDHNMHLEKRDYPFKCTKCPASFKDKQRLDNHRITHNRNQPHKCFVCQKKFSQFSSLSRHWSTHKQGVSRYKCDECSKTFWYPSALKAHQVVHTGEKPFKCTICGMNFGFREALIRHKKSHAGPSTTRQSVPRPVTTETLAAIPKESTSEEQESSKMIEHVKKGELSS